MVVDGRRACAPSSSPFVRFVLSEALVSVPSEPPVGLPSVDEIAGLYLELSPDSVALLDDQGRFVYVNPAFAGAAGRPAADCLGQKAFGFFHPEDKPALRRAWEDVRRSGGRVAVGGRWHGPEDTWRAWDLELIALPASGTVVGRVLFVARDAAERRRLEETLRRLQRYEILGRLTGSVVHDFNNLLTAIHGHSELLSRSLEAADPRRADALGLKAVADRAAALTSQLLAFNRRAAAHPKPVNVGESLGALEKTLRRLMGEDVEVRVQAPDRLPAVRLDPGWIEQIVIGVALVARESLPRGGRLTVSGEEFRDDAGERRVRVHVAAVPKPEGEGGAYRAAPGALDRDALAEVVRQSGGVWRPPEAGTPAPTFVVEWPAWSEYHRPRAAESGAAYRGSETVLLVEDDGTVRELARRVLQENGHRVIEAASAEEALNAVSAGSDVVDLLLSDVVLPGLSGLDLAVALRRRWPSLKVLLMSGSVDSPARPADFDGEKLFLPKPFRPKELARKVRDVLDESAATEAAR
jgi:PAS domain S-box-containing protein